MCFACCSCAVAALNCPATLQAALAHEHAVLSSRLWPGGPMLGAEVGLLDSNVVIESADGEYQAAEPAGAADPRQGQKFGAYVLVHGDNSSLRLSEVCPCSASAPPPLPLHSRSSPLTSWCLRFALGFLER